MVVFGGGDSRPGIDAVELHVSGHWVGASSSGRAVELWSWKSRFSGCVSAAAVAEIVR